MPRGQEKTIEKHGQRNSCQSLSNAIVYAYMYMLSGLPAKHRWSWMNLIWLTSGDVGNCTCTCSKLSTSFYFPNKIENWIEQKYPVQYLFIFTFKNPNPKVEGPDSALCGELQLAPFTEQLWQRSKEICRTSLSKSEKIRDDKRKEYKKRN